MEKSLEIPPSSRDLEVDADPPSWAARCLYWEVQTSPPVTPKRRTRRPKREALILTGHGMRLRVDSGALHIRGGLTHYPQKPEIWRFFPGDPAMPSRIIVVDGSGGLSFDVMSWLSEQNVPFVRIDWRGQVTSVVGNGHPINAMLNYAYAILENHVRTQIVAQGFDPSIGYLHASDPERHALVFDLMEPLRPLVDQLILGFISANTFTPRDFTLRSDGVCRVNPQLTRRLVAEFVNATERRNFVCDFLP